MESILWTGGVRDKRVPEANQEFETTGGLPNTDDSSKKETKPFESLNTSARPTSSPFQPQQDGMLTAARLPLTAELNLHGHTEPAHSSPTELPAQPEGVSLDNETKFLRTQARALQKLLALQENQLGHQIRVQCDGSMETESRTCTPGAQLLALWREKVFELLVTSETMTAVFEAKLTQAMQRAAEADRRANDRALRIEAIGAELNMMMQQLHEAIKSSERLKADNKDLTLRHERDQQWFNRLFNTSMEARHTWEHANLGQPLAAAIERMDGLSQRLDLMTRRMDVLKGLMRRGRVRSRNEAAALTAEKRAWIEERQKHEIQALRDIASGFMPENLSGSEDIVRILTQKVGLEPTPPSVSGLRGLRPDCEATMRVVFRQLDVDGIGSVEAPRFVFLSSICAES